VIDDNEEPVPSRSARRAIMPAWRGRKCSLVPMVAMALTLATMWATLACGATADERLLRDYAECLADPNSALHRSYVTNRIGTVPLSAEGMERRLNEQLERGTLTMDDIKTSYYLNCD